MAQKQDYTVHLTVEARVALENLSKLYPRSVSLTKIVSAAVVEKLEREKK